LKEVDPVMYHLLEKFYSSDKVSMEAFSIDSFKRAYRELGLPIPDIFKDPPKA